MQTHGQGWSWWSPCLREHFCPACCRAEALGNALACCGGYGRAADAEAWVAGRMHAALAHAATTRAVLGRAGQMHAVLCCAGLAYGAQPKQHALMLGGSGEQHAQLALAQPALAGAKPALFWTLQHLL